MDIENQIDALIKRFEAVVGNLNKASTTKGLAKWMIEDIVTALNQVQKGLALLKLTKLIANPVMLNGDNLKKVEEVIPKYAEKIAEYEDETNQVMLFAQMAQQIDFTNEPRPEPTGFDKFKKALES
jgi:hypothetical protein